MVESGRSLSFIFPFQSEKACLHPEGKGKSQSVRGTDLGGEVPVVKMRAAPWRDRGNPQRRVAGLHSGQMETVGEEPLPVLYRPLL